MKLGRVQTSTGPKAPTTTWEVTSSGFASTTNRIHSAASLGAHAPTWAADLRTIARIAFWADKRIKREWAPDRWTREVKVEVGVKEPEPWTNDALQLLSQTLTALTGDRWMLSVYHDEGEQRTAPLPEVDGWRADEVALFSGGLDSGAYAAQQIAGSDKRMLLLANDHADSGKLQRTLASQLAHLRPDAAAVKLFQVRDEPSGDRADGRNRKWEGSTRSRGFNFIASGVHVSSGHGLKRMAVPENGQVAVNPPLTAGRVSSGSTRSVHPWIIEQLNRLIEMVGGDVVVENPFLSLTKGDVAKVAKDAGVPSSSIQLTESCGQHPVQKGPGGNCGYCFPCLIRRSGIHAAFGYDPTIYRYRLDELQTAPQLEHLRDIQRWLARPFTITDLVAATALPSNVESSVLFSVIERGRSELRDVLGHAGAWAPSPSR